MKAGAGTAIARHLPEIYAVETARPADAKATVRMLIASPLHSYTGSDDVEL